MRTFLPSPTAAARVRSASLLAGDPAAGRATAIETVSCKARTRWLNGSGITLSSFASAPSTAGVTPERPSLRAERSPSASARASSSVNIIGGSLRPGRRR